jgi:hypothetical protein
MTRSPRRVQNRGVTGQWAIRQPFLASKAVIFGVNPTGPHILVVNYHIVVYSMKHHKATLEGVFPGYIALFRQAVIFYHLFLELRVFNSF